MPYADVSGILYNIKQIGKVVDVAQRHLKPWRRKNIFSKGEIKSNKSRMALENVNISWWNILSAPLNAFFFFTCNNTLHKQHIFNSS